MSRPFFDYVESFDSLLRGGRSLPGAPAVPAALPPVAADAPVCLVFSPHPDDEAIMGGLPWRLRAECGWRVVNVAVSLGSNVARRAARWRELTACCDFLGFDLVSASGETQHGLEQITDRAAVDDAPRWAHAVACAAGILQRHRPRLIVCPHANDGHPVHIGTHSLVRDALHTMEAGFTTHLALGEYWNTQPDPGLMVELGVREVATLVAALSLHAGEVARNPYHLTLPAWFMDAVRRGAERVSARGSAAPDFSFAALYGWRRWAGGQLQHLPGRLLPLTQSPAVLFD